MALETTEACCVGYWNESTSLCWTNSNQTAVGTLSTDNFCSTLSGLDTMGSDLGSFMENIAPGVGTFIVYLAVFGGVGALIYAIVHLVKKKISVGGDK